MRLIVWISGLWLGTWLAQAVTPAPPSLPIAYPFAGSSVSLAANGGGETLATQDFGSVPVGQTKQILLTLTYTSPQTIAGVQFSIQPGAKGDFALFPGQPPFPASLSQPMPIIVEFRPKSAGPHAAEIELYVSGGLLTKIPIAGSAN